MRVVLAPFGSRGDVAPLLALGQALRARGHTVVAAVPANSAAWAHGLGFEVAPGIPDFRDCFDGTHFEGAVVARVLKRTGALYAALEAAVAPPAPRPDWIVASMMQFAAASVAEQHGVRYAYAAMSPIYLRNHTLPVLAMPLRRTPRWLSRLHWWLSDHASPLVHGVLDRERARRGLPPVRRLYDHVVESGRIFVAADPALVPLPPDAQTLARAPLDVTGAWTLAEPVPPLPDLDRLLAASGPPVVYVGFGSMVHGDGARLARLLREAIARAGVRAVLGSGWSGLTAAEAAAASNGGLVLGEVPHAAVFPRMAAIVHHGGAGTFATAARAGVPQVVVSHLGDQHWHGWRVHELGLGPKPIVERVLTAEKLAAAIRSAVGEARFAARAREVGAELGGEGASTAAEILEREAAGPPAQRR